MLESPRDTNQRGSHVSFHHPQGYAVIQALIDQGVIGDFREPDLMRFGFTPLYVRFVDVWDAVAALADILKSSAWDRPQYKRRAPVT
jgi:kynureninase